MKTIETDRLRLRAFEKKDAETFATYRRDPEVAKYQGWEVDYSLSDAKDFIAEQQEAAFGTDGEWYQIAIAIKQSDELIGDIGLHFDADGRGLLTLGYTLAREHQGCGFAHEALSALVKMLEREGTSQKISAFTDVRNRPSQKLLERLHFENRRTIKKSGFFKGEWCDEYLYELEL